MTKIEEIAKAMYRRQVDPARGDIVLSIAVQEWNDLPDEYRSGIHVWRCKRFWRDAAATAIRTLSDPSEAMTKWFDSDQPYALETWQGMLDFILNEKPPGHL